MHHYSHNHVFRTRAQRNAGFTLVELLVVIVIIGILAALLLPVLSLAKERGLRLVCVANQKALGTAGHMYSDDNREYFAFTDWNDGRGGPAGWLYLVGTYGIPDPTLPPYNSATSVPGQSTGTYFKYMPNPKSYLCPVDLRDTGFSRRKNKLSSYVMNAAPVGYPGPAEGRIEGSRVAKVSDVWSQSCILMWEPDTKDPDAQSELEFNDGANYPGPCSRNKYNEGVGLLHGKKGGQIIAVDTHVEFITKVQFQAESLAPGTSRLWWSPFAKNGHF